MRGGYLLILYLKRPILLSTKSKNFKLTSGYYIYVGSAMNSLLGRIKHHEKVSKKFHWHVDFLLKEAELLFSVMITCFRSPETMVSSLLLGQPIPHFGSTDKKDPSHLFFYERLEDALRDAFRALRRTREFCILNPKA